MDSSDNRRHGKIVGAKWVRADGTPITKTPATTVSVAPQPTQHVVAPSVTKPTSPVPPRAVAPFDAPQAKAHQEAWAKHLGTKIETVNSIDMRMTLIPPGEFLMGTTPEKFELVKKMLEEFKVDPKSNKYTKLSAESPSHRVVLTKPFLMGT